MEEMSIYDEATATLTGENNEMGQDLYEDSGMVGGKVNEMEDLYEEPVAWGAEAKEESEGDSDYQELYAESMYSSIKAPKEECFAMSGKMSMLNLLF